MSLSPFGLGPMPDSHNVSLLVDLINKIKLVTHRYGLKVTG